MTTAKKSSHRGKSSQQLKNDEVELHKELAHKYYEIREKNPHYAFFNEHWINVYKNLLPKKRFKKALDLGCGTVEFYELVKSLGAEYVGVDLSPDMLAMGKRKYKKINLKVADAEKLPFKDETFDVVVCRGLVHHLPSPKKGCQEARRVLKKGGYFVVSEPHSNTLLYFVRKLYYKMSSHFSDSHKSFRREEFLELLKKSGFTIEKVSYWGILSFPFAFPDILPTYKLVPLPLFKLFVKLDTFLTKIPLINRFSWHIVVLCVKK